MNNIKKILLMLLVLIFALMHAFYKPYDFKKNLISNLEKTSEKLIFYCDIEGVSIESPLTISEKGDFIKILKQNNMETVFSGSKAFLKYWFTAGEYEIGFFRRCRNWYKEK